MYRAFTELHYSSAIDLDTLFFRPTPNQVHEPGLKQRALVVFTVTKLSQASILVEHCFFLFINKHETWNDLSCTTNPRLHGIMNCAMLVFGFFSTGSVDYVVCLGLFVVQRLGQKGALVAGCTAYCFYVVAFLIAYLVCVLRFVAIQHGGSQYDHNKLHFFP